MDPAGGGKVGALSEGDLPAGIGNPARGALREVGVTRLDQLTSWSEAELRALHGVGPKAIRILVDALQQRGLSLR